MESRKLFVINSHTFKPGNGLAKDGKPLEVPVSKNSKVIGVTLHPTSYLPVISIQEPAEEDEQKETMVRVFHLRPDGTPFKDANRFVHVGSVYALMFSNKLELVHVFEERVPPVREVWKEEEQESRFPSLPISHKVNG